MSHDVIFESARMNGEGVYDVSPEETLKKASEVSIIDVRRPDEFTGELGHIEGAKLATLETNLLKTLETLPQDKTYVFVCRSGGRSLQAAAMAHTKGFTNVYNMSGGMMQWNRLGLPTQK